MLAWEHAAGRVVTSQDHEPEADRAPNTHFCNRRHHLPVKPVHPGGLCGGEGASGALALSEQQQVWVAVAPGECNRHEHTAVHTRARQYGRQYTAVHGGWQLTLMTWMGRRDRPSAMRTACFSTAAWGGAGKSGWMRVCASKRATD